MDRERLGRWLTYVLATTPHWVIAWTMYPAGFGKVPLLLPAVLLLALLALVRRSAHPVPVRRYAPLAWAMVAYVVAYAVSAAAGVDWWKSVWGEESRQNGLVILAHLAVFAALLPTFLRTPDHWRHFRHWLFWPAVVLSVVIVLEALVPAVRGIYGEANRYAAWLGNPTFAGGYLALSVFVGLRLLVAERRPKRAEQVALVAGLALCAAGVFLTNSRGAALAFVAGAAVFAAVGGWRLLRRGAAGRSRKAAIVAVAALAVVGILWFAASKSGYGPGRVFRTDILSTDNVPRLISGRIALEGFLARPLTGWGPENFQTVFDRYYDPELLRYSFYETVSDKPHSLPLEVLVGGGILLATAWLALIGTLVAALLRLRREQLLPAAAGLALVAAYLVQTAFLFDILPTSLLLFALIGDVLAHAPAKEQAARPPLKAFAAAALVALFAADLFLLLPTVPVSGAVAQVVADPLVAPGSWAAAEARVAGNPGPHRDELSRHLALDFILRDGRGDWPQEAFAGQVKAVRVLMEGVAQRHPDDHMAHFLLGQLWGIEGEYGGGEAAFASAIRELERAQELSPQRQAVRMQMAKVHVAARRPEEAVRILEALVAEDPTQREPQFFLGLAYAGVGQIDRSAAAFAEALRLGRLLKTENETLFVIDVLAEAKRYEDIIPIYRQLIERQPQNAHWHARLAATYAAAGKLELAALEAQRAAEIEPAFRPQADEFLRQLENSAP